MLTGYIGRMNEEEYFKTLPGYIYNYPFSEPLYECPKCGALSVCRNNIVVLTSYPPQRQYRCIAAYGGCGKYVTSH